MQRHLSTGSALVSALMAAQRGREPGQQDGPDVIRLLASLGDRGGRAAPAMRPTTRDEDPSPASR